MPTRKKAMDLFLRDLDVEIEVETRQYRNNQHHPTATEFSKGVLAGLNLARRFASDAIARTEIRIPASCSEFMQLVDIEARAGALHSVSKQMEDRAFLDRALNGKKRPDEADLSSPPGPDNLQIFEEIMRMFHECALTGSLPEPLLPDPE